MFITATSDLVRGVPKLPSQGPIFGPELFEGLKSLIDPNFAQGTEVPGDVGLPQCPWPEPKEERTHTYLGPGGDAQCTEHLQLRGIRNSRGYGQ
ncbi:hypothetical protein OC835_004553 [Tilletia horrida]|nr:hypothetical protein OC835_004553 [Tilletia horrida]